MGAGLGLVLLRRIPYQAFPDQHGGHLYWVTLPISLAVAGESPRRTKRFEAVIDSGATRCLFHADLADALGLSLRSGVRETTNGIGGPQETWLHDVALSIPGGPVTIKAGFKETLPVAGLLGMNGFFEHFTVIFDTALRECDLERVYRA